MSITITTITIIIIIITITANFIHTATSITVNPKNRSHR